MCRLVVENDFDSAPDMATSDIEKISDTELNGTSRHDAYMAYMTENFKDELLALYEVDGSVEATQHLVACMECGLEVWDWPLQVSAP